MEDNFLVRLFLEDEPNTLQVITQVMNAVVDAAAQDVISMSETVQDAFNVDLSSSGIKVTNFLEITVEEFSGHEFQEHFRMKKTTMKALIQRLKDMLGDTERMLIPIEKKVHVTVWLLANKDSYREVANLFGLHISTVSYIFHEVCNWLAHCRYEFIKWPSQEEQNSTKRYILRRFKFPNCIGFIDGCHVQVLAPAKNPVDFYNRKDVHSVVLQGVCNEKLRFIDIYLGHTGRAHDARIFRESPIGDQLCNLLSKEDHILGDSAYTLSLNLLTPYRDNGRLTETETNYNRAHSAARSHIEKAFALLKGKFRRLKYLELHKTEDITIIICAACVLHNFVLENEPFCFDEYENDLNGNVNLECVNAIRKRNSVCQFIDMH